MCLHTRRRGTILQRINLETTLVRRPHSTLNTTVRQKSTNHHILNPLLAQEKVQVGRMESAQAKLALHVDITRGRLHRGMVFGVPRIGFERFTLSNSREDARPGPDLIVSLNERDGDVKDGASLGAHLGHERNGIFEHVVRLHAGFHGFVELATLGCEFILVFDEDQGRFGGVELECHGR